MSRTSLATDRRGASSVSVVLPSTSTPVLIILSDMTGREPNRLCLHRFGLPAAINAWMRGGGGSSAPRRGVRDTPAAMPRTDDASSPPTAFEGPDCADCDAST